MLRWYQWLRFKVRLLLAILLLSLLAGVAAGDTRVVLSYHRAEAHAPNVNWTTTEEQYAHLAETYANEGLTKEQVQYNLEQLKKEDAVIRNGRLIKYELDAIVGEEALAIRRHAQDGSDSEEEYLDREVYAFFHGSDSEVREYANGSIVPVALGDNNALKAPPDHWLPNSIGHRFAMCLLGYADLDKLLRTMKLVSEDGKSKQYQEGRYYWRLVTGTDGGPFKEIKWQVGDPAGYVGQVLSVFGWERVGGRLVAKGFQIQDFNKDGTKGDRRTFELSYFSELANASVKHIFDLVPTGTLVLDSRPPQPASYRLLGRIPALSEIANNRAPTQKKAARESSSDPMVWLAAAIVGTLVLLVAVSFKMAFRNKT